MTTFLLFGLFISAAGVLICRQTIYALLSLICTFIFSALYFINHNVIFIGLILMLVYVGAIAMLFLYMVMLLSSPSENKYENMFFDISNYITLIVGWFLMSILVNATKILDLIDNFEYPISNVLIQSDILNIALTFYSQNGVILILIGLFLFIAMVISVDIASKLQKE